MTAKLVVVHRQRVAIVGPTESVDDFLSLQPEFPGLELVSSPYEDERATVAVFKRALQTIPRPDVALFTGPIPYYLAVEAMGHPLPMLHVPFTEAGMYRTLFVAKGTVPLDGISVDTLDPAAVAETCRELGLTSTRTFALQYSSAIDREAFIEFHLAHFRAGRTTLALTCLRSAHEALKKARVPCLRIVPPRPVLVTTLEKASLMGDAVQSRERQLVVGHLQSRSASSANAKIKELDAIVRRFVDEVAGIYTRLGPRRWSFVTTRALLDSVGQGFETFLQQRLWLPDSGFALGIGMGGVAQQADVHARFALEHALADPRRQACYLVLENNQVVGPIGRGEVVSFSARSLDRDTPAFAQLANLSPALLARVTAGARRLGGGPFSAEDLAPLLKLTTRSTRRILRRLVEAGGAEIVGQDRLHRLGKPRRVYQMRWPTPPSHGAEDRARSLAATGEKARTR
jgi:hypothetical protein